VGLLRSVPKLVKSFPVSMMFFLCVGCVGPSVEQTIPGAQPLTPLAPIQLATKGAVHLENLCEDPTKDSYTLTPLEATADLLALPSTMLTYSARLVAYSTIGVGMAYSGVQAKDAVERINGWLPWGMAGPNPDEVHYRNIVTAENPCWRTNDSLNSGQGK
jgi:hypothetical protein